MARKNGFSVYVGEGANRWPAVHTLDAARLYRLAVEAAPAGTRLHGVAEEGVPFRQIAEAIGQGLGLPVATIAPDEAAKYLGFLATFVQVDNPSSSDATRALLQWEPTHARAARGPLGAALFRIAGIMSGSGYASAPQLRRVALRRLVREHKIIWRQRSTRIDE